MSVTDIEVPLSQGQVISIEAERHLAPKGEDRGIVHLTCYKRKFRRELRRRLRRCLREGVVIGYEDLNNQVAH